MDAVHLVLMGVLRPRVEELLAKQGPWEVMFLGCVISRLMGLHSSLSSAKALYFGGYCGRAIRCRTFCLIDRLVGRSLLQETVWSNSTDVARKLT